jgi:hypothetical protein
MSTLHCIAQDAAEKTQAKIISIFQQIESFGKYIEISCIA